MYTVLSIRFLYGNKSEYVNARQAYIGTAPKANFVFCVNYVSYATDLTIIIVVSVVVIIYLVVIVAVIAIYCRNRRLRPRRRPKRAAGPTRVRAGQRETDSKTGDSREYAEQSSRATRIATLLGDPRNPTPIVGHMQFRLPVHRNPMQLGVLPRINSFGNVRSINRGGYTTHIPRPWSDEYYSGQIGNGYKYLSRHGDGDRYTPYPSRHSDNEVDHRFLLRPRPFGGITPKFRSEFGYTQSTLLQGRLHHSNVGANAP